MSPTPTRGSPDSKRFLHRPWKGGGSAIQAKLPVETQQRAVSVLETFSSVTATDPLLGRDGCSHDELHLNTLGDRGAHGRGGRGRLERRGKVRSTITVRMWCLVAVL